MDGLLNIIFFTHLGVVCNDYKGGKTGLLRFCFSYFFGLWVLSDQTIS